MNENKRILLVDDDELILSTFERLLGRRFRLDIAAGSTQALQAIETQGPYAVVVSDMRMPGMNGLELLVRTKQMAPQTIGLLMSGNVHLDAVDRAVQEGVVFQVVQKPCPHEELIAILEDALVQHTWNGLVGNSC